MYKAFKNSYDVAYGTVDSTNTNSGNVPHGPADWTFNDKTNSATARY